MSAPPFLKASSFAAWPGLAHGFFGRRGGVSGGIYASLNTGLGSRDDPAAVAENRSRAARALGFIPERLVGAYQVHGRTALRVAAPWAGDRPECDALVSTTPGLALCVLAADCLPVLFADGEAGVVACAHAGWKGLLAGVLESTVAAMLEAGAQAGRIRAAIGPAIAQASYEVGPELQAQFTQADAAASAYFAPGRGDRRQFDLPGYAGARLSRLGLEGIELAAVDVCAQAEDFFSNRRSFLRGEPDFGRNISVIGLLP